MNINDQWCVTALFKAHLGVGGVSVCICACQMAGSGLRSGDMCCYVGPSYTLTH